MASCITPVVVNINNINLTARGVQFAFGDAMFNRCTTVVKTFFCRRDSRPASDPAPMASKHSKASPTATSSSLLDKVSTRMGTLQMV